jgi:hypothetical protein
MGRLPTVAATVLVLALVAGLSLLASAERPNRDAAASDERLYLPDGELLRYASLGFQAPVADYTWLQATQYYGGYRHGDHDLRYFAGLVEAVTDLDPRFEDAYVFAALVQCFDHEDYPGAIDILKRGVLANPDSWRLHFEIGFVHYVFTREFEIASRWFDAAAQLPGASDFCRRFAAWSAKRAGDLRGSLLLWENLRRTTDSPDMRELATRMVEQLEASLAGAPLPGETGPPAPTSQKGRP